MYTAIAETRNINIQASSLLLETTSTEKRSYQYNKLHTLLYRYQHFDDLSSLHYLCLLNQFSDIITIKVLAVGIPHAEATT